MKGPHVGGGGALLAALLATTAGCDSRDASPDPAAKAPPAARVAAGAADTTAADDPDIEEVRKARAALAAAGVPVYPGASGLDATEFEANTAPFIAVDFFTTAPPETVTAFYDREIEDLAVRRDTTIEPGAVRYEFERAFSGVAVRPWDPKGADSTGFFARFDRRDAQGVSSSELDAYGRLLERARTHVVVNLPRPEPEES